MIAFSDVSFQYLAISVDLIFVRDMGAKNDREASMMMRAVLCSDLIATYIRTYTNIYFLMNRSKCGTSALAGVNLP